MKIFSNYFVVISGLIILIISGCKTSSISTVPSKIPGYQLVWADEFNQEGTPDASRWAYETGMIRNHEKQYYTRNPKNATVKNGHLILTAHLESLVNDNYVAGSKKWRTSQPNANYSAASLTTEGKAAWQYGRIQVRAKLPKGRGLWPAIWMLGEDWKKIGWPECGEIDIMEHVGYEPDQIFGTVHTKAFNHTIGTEVGKKVKIEKPYREYHEYAVEWTPDQIDFLLDGKKYHEFKNQHKTTAEWPFDQPFHLKLNIAVGGDWGGLKGIDDSIFPQEMLIDYVRVYQKK